jgi:hypothetical protein
LLKSWISTIMSVRAVDTGITTLLEIEKTWGGGVVPKEDQRGRGRTAILRAQPWKSGTLRKAPIMYGAAKAPLESIRMTNEPVIRV